MPTVRKQSPKFLSQTPYLFQMPFHLISLSCHFFILKMLMSMSFKFLERLKQPLPKISFCFLALELSIERSSCLFGHIALGLSFVFFAGFLHDVVISCLSSGRKYK